MNFLIAICCYFNNASSVERCGRRQAVVLRAFNSEFSEPRTGLRGLPFGMGFGPPRPRGCRNPGPAGRAHPVPSVGGRRGLQAGAAQQLPRVQPGGVRCVPWAQWPVSSRGMKHQARWSWREPRGHSSQGQSPDYSGTAVTGLRSAGRWPKRLVRRGHSRQPGPGFRDPKPCLLPGT
jgi:hypothetical protein